MLDSDKAKLLESRALERLNSNDKDGSDKLVQTIIKLAVRATIVTLQEYEKMSENQDL